MNEGGCHSVENELGNGSALIFSHVNYPKSKNNISPNEFINPEYSQRHFGGGGGGMHISGFFLEQ